MAGDEEGNPTPASYASPPHGIESALEVGEGRDGEQQHTTTESAISSRTVGSTSSTARRDRVSVGSRMNRTIIVRPPYAARDELDFERRPRSNTNGTTLTGSDGNTAAGRHPGIQPPLHASIKSNSTTTDGTTRSNGSSTLSGTTRGGGGGVNEGGTASSSPPDTAVFSEKGDHTGLGNNDGNDAVHNAKMKNEGTATADNEKDASTSNHDRPSIPHRESSNDASRWRAFTLPMKYRKMLDDYSAKARSEHDPQSAATANNNNNNSNNQPHPDPSSHHHFFGAHHNIQEEPPAVEDASDIDSDESSGDYHYRYFGRRKKQQQRRNSLSLSRRASGEDNAAAAYDEDGNPIRSRLPHRHTNNRQQSSRRSSWDRGRNRQQPQQQGGGGGGGGEGISMAPHATNMSRHNSAMGGGWNSPWLPNAGADPESNIPGSLHFPGLTSGHNALDAIGGGSNSNNNNNGSKAKVKTRTQQFRRWVVRSAFAPLAFRMMNLAFTAALLGVAVSIRQIASRNDVMGIMGSSTIFAIVISPLSIFHILFNLYTEYFGSPIGVWKVRSKMFYTFTELIFICLWSGLLSLAFDDLFTSPAGCTSYTPNARYRQVQVGDAFTSGTLADRLCDHQAALVSLVFVGLILYVLVLIVSLFRIFAKISRIQ